jgi:hypothetical protein
MVYWAASLAVLIEALIEGLRVSFLRRCSKKFLPIFWGRGRSHQNQCCVLVWGSFAGYHCSGVLELIEH